MQNHTFPFFETNETVRKIIFFILLLFCMTSYISPPIALLLGLIIANISGHPFLHLNHKATNILLQISVVGLGFGMNLNSALSAGKEGFVFTMFFHCKYISFRYFFRKMAQDRKENIAFNFLRNSHLRRKCHCSNFTSNTIR